MSFISKLFGIDTKATKRAAEAQATAIRESSERTAEQSRLLAAQSAAQQAAAAERARVQEHATAVAEAPAAPIQVDIGTPEGEQPVRKKRAAYQAPGSVSSSIRI